MDSTSTQSKLGHEGHSTHERVRVSHVSEQLRWVATDSLGCSAVPGAQRCPAVVATKPLTLHRLLRLAPVGISVITR